MSVDVCIKALRGPLKGSIEVPGDKSISHRAVLFSAMAKGSSQLMGVLDSEDVRSSMRAVSQLGAQVDLQKQADGSLAGTICGWGDKGPRQPESPIDCGNSGTTARLLMGVLAPWDIRVELTGDDSLCRRPMRRITAPLMKMGVHFEPAGQEHLPIVEQGRSPLKAISYDSPMSSAQLKTAVLLAGLGAEGKTTLNEPSPSRNHTELMLPEYGALTTAGTCTASVTGPCVLRASKVVVPGDPSSAAFLVCAAVLQPGSDICVQNVSLNAARTGFLRTLERMGAKVAWSYKDSEGKEPYGDITACYSGQLRGCEIPSQHIASEIDEIPVLALVAACAHGITVFRDVSELRVKETDRAQAIIDGLALLGVDAWLEGEDLFVEGCPGLHIPQGLRMDSNKDHRLAMTWALAGMCLGEELEVANFDSVAISFPTFLETIERLQS